MDLLSILLFSISVSSDNFIVGLSYGTKKIKINFISNTLVAFISCLGTFVSMLLGKYFNNFISPHIADILGSLMLMLFGIYMLIGAYKSSHGASDIIETVYDHPEIIDTNNSNIIELKEAIILGFILCINNIGLGIGASFAGLNIFLTSAASFIFSMIFIKLGDYIGKSFISNKLSHISQYVSSLIIILLGLYELIF
ncbi:sporulation membrane protein YtaF [Clostridium sp. 19966]|uniref:sporulation membrane protein YtaF n=1 Tax=Clostridium sp. 19966 TaxID=2768166 RepID=UPI0028E03154|nr:sporulation membrane protein YtaF [Clostridium sp. 19966]MDT8718667.1 sporulation membrane protein YtaF [Clostridium sp. 19966]